MDNEVIRATFVPVDDSNTCNNRCNSKGHVLPTEQINVAAVTLRAVFALGVVVGFVAWLTLRTDQNRLVVGCVVSGMACVYLTLAYFFVPGRGKRFSMVELVSPLNTARRTRTTLRSIKLFLWPGRFLAISLIDFVAMLFGRQVDHDKTKVDVVR